MCESTHKEVELEKKTLNLVESMSNHQPSSVEIYSATWGSKEMPDIQIVTFYHVRLIYLLKTIGFLMTSSHVYILSLFTLSLTAFCHPHSLQISDLLSPLKYFPFFQSHVNWSSVVTSCLLCLSVYFMILSHMCVCVCM